MTIKPIIRTYNMPSDPVIGRRRMDWAFNLQRELESLDALVSLDLQGDPYQHVLSVLNGFKSSEIDGILHVEDDAILCHDFIDRMQVEVEQHPGSIVQFYSRFEDDPSKQSGWRPPKKFVGGVCFYMPAAMISSISEYLEHWYLRDTNPTAWDIAIRYWMMYQRMQYWLVLPNLADHRISPSTIDRDRPEDRSSYTFER